MAGPFPGMNPYLEHPDVWPEFHTAFIVALRAELNKNLPRGFLARLDRYVWVEDPETLEQELLGKPDAYVVANSERSDYARTDVAILAAPVELVRQAVKHPGNRFIKVVDAENKRVVTVIGVLSPSNKTPGKDHDAYMAKRDEYLGLEINLVEIDLLRSGRCPTWGDSPPQPSECSVLVFPARSWPKAGYWPVSIRDTLPTLPIPLTTERADVPLSLQACFDRAFQDGRYDEALDYSRAPVPPFPEADARWVREMISRQST